MSDDLSFNRKYRPTKLTEYIGNDKIKENCISSLANKSKPQVLLFHGKAGCGKTTMARLMVKEYKCQNRDIVTGACGVCYDCKECDHYIVSGDYTNIVDLREVDATDSNGRKDIDELLDDANYPSLTGNWKIFVIDECHMLTVTAQNRLLKSLEEPQEKVLFILCTTNPEKLIEAIVSRCHYKYRVRKPVLKEILPLLVRVCKTEQVEFDMKGLSQVAVRSDFVPRDSLINLEKVVRAHSSAGYSAVIDTLDIISTEYFVKFYKLLLGGSANIMNYVNFLSGVMDVFDLKQYMADLVSFTKRGLYTVNGVTVSGMDASEVKLYSDLFGKLPVDAISHILDTVLNIESSNDIESRLLLLGYRGLVPKRNTDTNTGSDSEKDHLNEDAFNAQDEERHGVEEHLKSKQMTEEEKEVFLAKSTQPIDHSTLVAMFGAEVVSNE